MKKNTLILCIAAFLIVAIIAVAFLIGNGDSDPGTPLPTPTPTASPNEVIPPKGDIVPFDKVVDPTPTPYNPSGTTPTASTTGSTNPTITPTPTVDLKYGYNTFMANANSIKSMFAGKVDVTSIGKSEFGREIVCFRLGKSDAEHKLLMVAGVNGSEYGASLIMMKQIETYLSSLDDVYRSGRTYKSIFDFCSIYFIPMLNPDGIEININGLASVPADKQATVTSILNLGGTNDFSLWNANGEGVDVSINFGTGTVPSTSLSTSPAMSGYPGTPFSTKSAQAVKALCENNEFLLTTVYSGCGKFVDWCFGNEDNITSILYSNIIANRSGYTKIANGPTPEECITVSLSQWFVSQYNKSGVTLMVGAGTSAPYTQADLDDMWDSLSAIPPYLAYLGDISEGEETANPDEFITIEPTFENTLSVPF